MGSVKDLELLEDPTPESPGRAIFNFSDRYSVFDWGPMPENLSRKGEALAMMGAYTFEKFEESGVDTHYIGMEEEGKVKKVDELEGPSNRMHVKYVNVIEPEFKEGSYDYSMFEDPSLSNYLVPLEIIFRNRVPVGSSARSRYDPRELGLEVEEWPEEAISLEDPIVEASTKLEEQDRYIDDEEAGRMTGQASLQDIYEITRRANRAITERAEEVGMTHDDGKLEFLFIDGDVVVGDVAGTFDEDRFTFKGRQVSKEILRQAYKKIQPGWVEAVKEAKKEALEEGIEDWKDMVGVNPCPLGFEDLAGEIYQAGANMYIGKDFFEAGDLEELMSDFEREVEACL